MSIKKGKIKKKKTKEGKKLTKVSFDDEIVTKIQAEQILSSQEKSKHLNSNKLQIHIKSDNVDISSNVVNPKKKKPKKKKLKTECKVEETKKVIETPKNVECSNSESTQESTECSNTESKQESTECSNPKKRKRKLALEESTENNTGDTNDTSTNKPKPLSIRAQKKLKHAKLVEEKKLKTELGLQEKSLNYLSKWKHARSEWKFEKLRQIWLQQNLFDRNKIPIEFWDTVIEYMRNASGHVRDILCKEALKIIEKEDSDEKADQDEVKSRLKRARDIIQHLNE